MKTERENDKELLDLLGEPARADGGDAPTDERAEYAALLNEVRAADVAGPLARFNDRLRDAWVSEVAASQAARPTPSRNWWRLSIPLAAAAVIGFVLLWPGGLVNDGGGSGVAWADVVKAMDRVSHFHMIVFADDPRSADEKTKMFRMDLFYQQPDRWRAHGMGHVAFSVDGKRQTWSVEKRKFAEKGDRAPDMFPREFVELHRKSGTLPAVLASIFNGKVPAGEPVKSDEVSAAQGIDVFDYAQKASDTWVRIWVLRESKLPLKMHLFHPSSDEFTLVNFDYSDPQPQTFFDADAFARQAATLSDGDPYRHYSIGSTPVAGARPRAADQVHAVEGGYRAPVVKRVLSNADGDVALVTDNPRNLTPTGRHPLQQEYRRVTDNWGNTLISAGGWSRVSSGSRHTYLMPLPPVKRGEGPREVTVSYVIEPEHGTEIVLKTETLSVPDPSVAGQPNDWAKELPQQKQSVLRNYLQEFGTLAQQLEAIDAALAKDPKALSALGWRFQLLREHGREDAAWAQFERQMRDRIFGDPALLNDQYSNAAQYLMYLAGKGRDEELARLSQVARKMMEHARSKKDSRGGSKLYNLERIEHNPLCPAAHVLEWRETFKDGPQVVRTLAGRDGLVFIELAIPKPPEGWSSNGWDGQAPYGWFWQPTFGEGWQIQARMPKVEEGRLWLIARGQGTQVSLSGEAILALDNYGSKPTRHDAKVRWSRTIDVPPPTIDDMKAWWFATNGNSDKGWWPLPPPSTQPAAPVAAGPREWMHEANTLRDAGKFEDAVPLYAMAIGAPRGDWPAAYTQGVGLLDTVGMLNRQMRVSLARCLAELGRMEEARKVAAELRSMLPEQPDLADPLQGNVAADALLAELCVPRAMLKRGDVTGAAAELYRLAAHRSKLTDLPDGTLMVDRGPAKFGWHPRSTQKEAWRQYDALWWEVKDALGSSATRPTTSAAAG